MNRPTQQIVLALGAFAGALAAQVPLGPGCGTPAPTLAVAGAATVPSPHSLVTQGLPGAALAQFASVGAADADFGNGCHVYLDLGALITLGSAVAGGAAPDGRLRRSAASP